MKHCRVCKSLTELHYEEPGEKPYIKYTCGNKCGLNSDYQVDPDTDYCSRLEEKPAPAVNVGDEVCVGGCYGVIVREPYTIGPLDDPATLVVVWYGSHMSSTNVNNVKPTGKHFPEIPRIMEELYHDKYSDSLMEKDE